MSKNSDDKFPNDDFGVEGPVWADGKIINEQFTMAVRKFMQMETLTPALLNELIEKSRFIPLKERAITEHRKSLFITASSGLLKIP